MENKSSGMAIELITDTIRTMRGRRIILDADLAKLYGVSTSRFNEAGKKKQETISG